MSQVDPNPAPEAPAPAAAAQAAPQDSFIRVDPARVRATGFNDYNQAFVAAKQYRDYEQQGVYDDYARLRQEASRYGMTVKDYLDAMLAPLPPEQSQTPQQRQPDPSQMQFTPEVIQGMFAEHRKGIMEDFGKMRQEDQAQFEAGRQKAAEQQARLAEDAAVVKHLAGLGFKAPEQGRKDYAFSMMYGGLAMALRDVKESQVPSIATQEEREARLSGEATPQQFEEAIKVWRDGLTDRDNLVIASFAKQQADVPNATATGTPGGGSTPPKHYEDMTREEQIAATTAHMRGRRA